MPKRWRPVLGYEKQYEVSDYGDVRRLGGGLLSSRASRGYRAVALYCGGISRTQMVARIVLESFGDTRPLYTRIIFANGDRTDCRLSNLDWAQVKEIEPEIQPHYHLATLDTPEQRQAAVEAIACVLLDRMDPQRITLNPHVSAFVDAYTRAEQMTQPQQST